MPSSRAANVAFFIALLTSALVLGPALAHTIELPNKIGLSRDLTPVTGRPDNEALAQCIDACFACAQTCISCADACMAEPASSSLARCIPLDLDCADACERACHQAATTSGLRAR